MKLSRRLLQWTLPLACVALSAGCEKKPMKGVGTNHPTINLFGFEESQLHHIHNTVELHRNVFLVRYDEKHPDKIEWVNCPVSAEYTYRKANGRRVESMVVHNSAELRAKVPVQAARFEGYMSRGKGLEFNYVTIGSYELVGKLQIPKDDPDCARATHYVVTLSVGAFSYNEASAISGGISGEEAATGVGAGVSGSHDKSKGTSVGDLQACMDDGTAFTECFTPLQVMMVPLAGRDWASGGEVATWTSTTSDSGSSTPSTATEPPPAAQTLALSVDENAWRPGSFMALALEQILVVASRIDETTNYGYDDKASTVVAGYLTPSQPQALNRYFEAGQTYALFATGATDANNIDIVVTSETGQEVAADREADENPAVVFSPPTTGMYRIDLTLASGEEEFAAMVIMRDGGMKITPEILQPAFQTLLDNAAAASQKVIEAGFPNGLVFHEKDWSLNATILYPGELIRQTDIRLDSGAAVFSAVAHDTTMNIDLQVTNNTTGVVTEDVAPDANPLVLVESDGASVWDLAVVYPAGEGATLATALILKLAQ